MDVYYGEIASTAKRRNSMARPLMCQICKEKSPREEMEVDEKISPKSGKVSRKYYHKGECWETFQEQRAFTDKENEEWDYLWSVFEEVYGFPVPSRFVPFLQDLRNGTIRVGKVRRRTKRGYPFKLIAETYKACESDIEWAKKTKDFKGTLQECQYGLAIVANNIVKVRSKAEREERQRKAIQEQVKEEMQSETFFTSVKYDKSKQTKRVDISDLL